MWTTEGNFEKERQPWNQVTQAIKYNYEPKKESQITAVLLNAVPKDLGLFFRLTLTCYNETTQHTLERALLPYQPSLKTEKLDSIELFFISRDVAQLMRFIDVVSLVEPKVMPLKDLIKAQCEKATSPALITPSALATLSPKIQVASFSRPSFSDLQPLLPRRKASFS